MTIQIDNDEAVKAGMVELELEEMDDVQRRKRKGQYRGRQVSLVRKATSMITEAQEEMTFGLSEVVEKKLSKRKLKKRTKLSRKAKEKLRLTLRKVPDIGNPQKLINFLENLKGLQDVNAQTILREVAQYFEDVSHQYAALAFVHDVLDDSKEDEALKRAVEEAIDTLEEEKGPEIRAGINITRDAVDYSRLGLGDVQELRDFYRNTILQYESLNKTYECIVEQYDKTRFQQITSFLITAVGNDLQSYGPSISPEELKRIIDDLYQLEVLQNLNESAGLLYRKLEKQFNMKFHNKPIDFMHKVLQIKANKWLRVDDVMQIADELRLIDIEARIYFIRELKEMIRLLPIKAHESLETREKLIDVVQEALDTAIEMEEEEL